MSTIRFSQVKTTQDILDVSCLFKQHSHRDLSHIIVKECIENHPHVLAYDDDDLIGFIYTKDFAPDILEIYNMFIHPDYRYQGIGTLMIQHMIDNIEEKYQGIIVVNSALYDNNDDFIPASPFYIRNDFDIISKTDNTTVLYCDLRGVRHGQCT